MLSEQVNLALQRTIFASLSLSITTELSYSVS